MTNPFRDVILWPSAKLMVTGAETHLLFHDPATAELVARIQLSEDWFGSFVPDPEETLYVLGWRHVVAIGDDLAVRWTSRWIAVDGIVWRRREGGRLYLSAEHDPPDGWQDVALDEATGRIVEGIGWAGEGS